MSAQRLVTLQVEVYTPTFWAPEDSDWRPWGPPRTDELHVYVASVNED